MRLVEFVHHFYDREIQRAKHSRYAIDPDAVEAVMDDEDGTKIRLTSGAVVPVSQTYEEAVAALRGGDREASALFATVVAIAIFFFLFWASGRFLDLETPGSIIAAVIGTPVLLVIIGALVNRKYEDGA